MIRDLKIVRGIEFNQIFANVIPGLIAGVFAVIYCISFAALIFSDKLSSYLPIGIGLMLLTAVIVSLIVASFSSFPCSIAGPQDTTAAFFP